MSGAKSRRKGVRGEQEFLTLVNKALGTDLKRNLSQYQRTDADLPDLGGFCVEVKRQAEFSPSWWAQAVSQAERVGRMPALAYRCDYQREWSVMLYGRDIIPMADGDYTVTMPLDAFFVLIGKIKGPLEKLADLTAKTRDAQKSTKRGSYVNRNTK